MKHIDEYRDPELSRNIVDKIMAISRKRVRLMEVCGTHTMAIFRSGIRALLPETITLLSGPGCPVCVTSQQEIDAFIKVARVKDVIVATFGDLMRVPGTHSSLQKERAKGKEIQIVYSAFDALDLAESNPQKDVVFLGIGFETTAPTIAASIMEAEKRELDNFSVLSAHKLVPPALSALMTADDVRIEGNKKARQIMYQVFEPTDARWRGIGTIPQSGLKIRREFDSFNAEKRFDLSVPDSKEPKGCACGEILIGMKTPPECPLYNEVCTPSHPVGPCMVSTEGTCAAYYKYDA